MRREFNLSTGEETLFPDAVPTNPNPPDFSALDQDELNRVLASPGSILRAALEIQFGMIKGTIPVNPALTPAGYKAMLRAQMALQRT